MDLDGDGKRDLLSGSWPGELYLFKDLAAEPVKLKHGDGKEINCGSASAVFATDWDGDGDLDLLVGNIDGRLFFVPGGQEGFGKAVDLGFNPTPGGDSAPCVADWDGDGKPDLLTGCGTGAVYWRRATGRDENGLPTLAQPKELYPEGTRLWAKRSKVCVADWNGDGKLDLLLGDFDSRKVKQTLTQEQKEAHAKAKAAQDAVMAEMARMQEKLSPTELNADPEYQKLVRRMQEHNEVLQKYSATKTEWLGRVWVFLRK